MAKASNAIGNHKKSYDYLRLANYYHNIQFNTKRDSKISELNKIYQTQRKQHEIERQKDTIKYNESEIKNLHYRSIFFGVGMVLFLFFLIIVYRHKIKINLINI